MKFAKCHPNRKHKGHGMCGSCYVAWLVSKYTGEKKTDYDRMKRLCGRISQLAKKTGRKYADVKVEVDFLLSAQTVCEICASDEQLCIDHDHSTGKVRGLLCNRCNWLIGLVKEREDTLHNANRYLMRKWLENQPNDPSL